MSKYTAEDFANAEFARHPDGRIAARLYPGLKEQWAMFESAWVSSDHQLAIDDWVPVPDQVPGRTITAAKFNQAVDIAMDSGEFDTDEFARQLGITIVPDPEPTNAEKLAIYLGLHDLDAITQDGVAEFARQLDADGVKAPGGDDDH